MPGLTINDAADMIGIPVAKLRELTQSGEIPAAKIGKRWIYHDATLDKWLSEQVTEQTKQRRNPAPKRQPARGRPRRELPELNIRG